MKMWTYVFSRRKGAMLFLVCLFLYHTVSVESYVNDQSELLKEILNSQGNREVSNSPDKRGWEAWELPWMKNTAGRTKRAWEAAGVNFGYGIINQDTLDQLKRGWEGFNLNYGWNQGKRSFLPDKYFTKHPSHATNVNYNDCQCCKESKNPSCCLLCSTEINSERTTDMEQGYNPFVNRFCKCCSLLSDADCCRFCGLLQT